MCNRLHRFKKLTFSRKPFQCIEFWCGLLVWNLVTPKEKNVAQFNLSHKHCIKWDWKANFFGWLESNCATFFFEGGLTYVLGIILSSHQKLLLSDIEKLIERGENELIKLFNLTLCNVTIVFNKRLLIGLFYVTYAYGFHFISTQYTMWWKKLWRSICFYSQAFS